MNPPTPPKSRPEPGKGLAIAAGVMGCVPALVALAAPAWSLPWRGLAVLLSLATSAALVRKVLGLRRTARAREGAKRELHLAGLLRMAAEVCFELDLRGCLVALRSDDPAWRDAFAQQVRPTPLWLLPGVRLDKAGLDALRQALLTPQPLRGVQLQRAGTDGAMRHWQLSIEPCLDPEGRLLGYCGLLRDVSDEVQARNELARTESRLHDLFRRIPTPLVLHRGARVLDANPAAVAMFGYPDLASMIDQDLTPAFAAGESRERLVARMNALALLPTGQHLPMAEFHLTPRDGRELIVQSTAVSVEGEDHARAALSMLLDDTERRQSEEAMRRSEALLSHLVANSPDLITLTDLSTGRYAMVNPTFTRVTGYAAQDVLGKTSLEIGIWAELAERDRLIAALRENDTAQDLPATFVVRDGRRVSMLGSAARFSMDERDYLIINARDITAAEQARLEREAILENALIVICLTRDQHFMLVNPRFEQMVGWPPGQLVGQHASVVWPSSAVHEEVSQLIGARLARGEQIEIEQPILRRDGSQFLCRLQAKAVDPTHPSRGGTIWLAEDVTSRRQVEQALARARDQAEAASRAKSAFLANTSHEIRTPLNALLGLARLARQPTLDESRRRQYIEQISESAETLSTILSDILDLSKIEAGKMHLEQMAFDLPSLLMSLHQAYGALADTKGLTLTLDRDADLPAAVLGDPMRVRQILSNYLNNALKFTQSGQLRIGAHRIRPGLVRFEVTDTGPGIDEATQALLFTPFTQADNSITRSFGGTGLGLSICRQLAQMMGGTVGVVSVLGQGSCFWAELPLPDGDPDELDSGSTTGGIDPIHGAHVLMVEDNAVNMMIAVALLENWGADVMQAADGQDALDAVERAAERGYPFDLVLMDVQMPGMSGHEATLRLRKRYSRAELPIIALTAAALVSERNQALAAGMNDFLTKPIDAQRLRHALTRALREGAAKP
jgi:PAS domain S-box-containing protein